MNIKKHILALISLITATVTADADIIVQPDTLKAGDTYRLIFVTEGTIDATSDDLVTYQEFARTQANSVPELSALKVEWHPVVSVSSYGKNQDARNVIWANPVGATPDPSPSAGFFTLAGEQIAKDNEDLWSGSIAAPVNMTQSGKTVDGAEQIVWTGTQKTGWAAKEALGKFPDGKTGRGSATTKEGGWLNAGTKPSKKEHSIYVISDIITVTN